ncbi:MAG: glycosyltransferase family 39 protein [Bacteroidota bacterium]
MILNKLKEYRSIIILLLVQAGLLLTHYTSIPFSHDELSAISRCNVTSFNQLITEGVRPDGHPAGVQLLLYGMIQAFGIHEWILKLPFLIAGLLSLLFLFNISKRLFSNEAAIISSVLFIFSQYYLYQMTVARPYSMGLCFVLGIFYYSLKMIDVPSERKNYFIWSLLLVGAYYSHYFSFLQALIIVALFAVIYFKQINWRYYLLGVGISLICFIPHLSITLYQLSMGGLGWLGKPDSHFFTAYFFTLFNESVIMIAAFVLLLILTFSDIITSTRKVLLLALLFIIPVAILFLYSYYRAPVLQDAALFFCSPFLLILSGKGVLLLKRMAPAFILIITAASVFSLLFEKHYFQYKTYQPIERFVIKSKQLLQQSPDPPKTLIVWKGNHNYLNYYLTKHGFNHPVITTDTLQNLSAIQFYKYNNIICNQLPPDMMTVIEKNFPDISSTDNNLSYTCQQLTAEGGQQALYYTAAVFSLYCEPDAEWSKNNYTEPLKESDRYRFLELFPQPDTLMNEVELVVEVYHHNEKIHWASTPVEKGNVLSLKLKDIVKELPLDGDITWKCYLWNKEKQQLNPLAVVLKFRDDNPFEYRFTTEGL